MKIVTASFIIAIILLVAFGTGSKTNEIDNYRFSNTATWDAELRLYADREVSIANWAEHINIPPPPANSSLETAGELEELVSYKNLRTEEKMKQIIDEQSENGIMFDGKLLQDYFDFSKYPETASLFAVPYKDITTITLLLKKQFDRVRPSVLEPDINPIIEIPGHPAYPSGHSTQAHFVAYLLSEIFPEKTELLMVEAGRIAKNREIAGVHYKSDSEAGKILARQFVDLLLKNPETRIKIEKSRMELINE